MSCDSGFISRLLHYIVAGAARASERSQGGGSARSVRPEVPWVALPQFPFGFIPDSWGLKLPLLSPPQSLLGGRSGTHPSHLHPQDPRWTPRGSL